MTCLALIWSPAYICLCAMAFILMPMLGRTQGFDVVCFCALAAALILTCALAQMDAELAKAYSCDYLVQQHVLMTAHELLNNAMQEGQVTQGIMPQMHAILSGFADSTLNKIQTVGGTVRIATFLHMLLMCHVHI